MYTYHYLVPENQWGVFDAITNEFIMRFDTLQEAQDYCIKHNDKDQ